MNRCKRLSPPALAFSRAAPSSYLLWLSVLLGAALLPLPLAAQNQERQEGMREFPHNALRGILQVTTPPDVLLDGRADRLSPGVRIRSPQNTLMMSGALAGQALVVNFTRENSGLIHEVWLLTPNEAAQKIKLATPARNFIFESELDTTRRDDGKTPFNQLPVFPNR